MDRRQGRATPLHRSEKSWFPLKNDEFWLKIVDFLLKNVDFIVKYRLLDGHERRRVFPPRIVPEELGGLEPRRASNARYWSDEFCIQNDELCI